MTTWTTQLTTLESRAAEHDSFGNLLISKLADPLKFYAGRFEEMRKAHAEFAFKLEKERDSAYGEMRKMKGKYDSVCQEVENRRKKTENSFDHSKNKARNAFEGQQVEMRNIKVGEAINRCGFRLIEAEHLHHQHQCDEQTEGTILPRIRS
jgi:formin-binding protein 1